MVNEQQKQVLSAITAQHIEKQNDMNKELMILIVNLNESVKVLGQRFESFQSSIEDKVNRISAEQILIKNKVDFLEKNCLPKINNI